MILPTFSDAMDKLEKLEAENKRLRGLLREFVEGDAAGLAYEHDELNCIYCETYAPSSTDSFSHKNYCPIVRARAALEDRPAQEDKT